jgi:mono/diheme cytochrome c family protein
VRGLGHCVACHSPRNAFGATDENLELSGGLVPMQGWYAPSLTSMREAGVGDWETRHVVDLLRAGVSEKGSVMGPMAEVVFRSTQYLSQDDLRAMAVFLKALPQSSGSAAEAENRGLSPISEEVRAKGSKIYEQSCASCHGDDGEGAPGAYPALAGNRAVTMGIAANLVRVVLSGGYLPATAANPRPYGMPPFAHVLSDSDIAAVVSFIRGAWGNTAEPVSQLQVMKFRAGEPE